MSQASSFFLFSHNFSLYHNLKHLTTKFPNRGLKNFLASSNLLL